ncbi:MAG: hypothetical protein ACR2H4_11120 [Pyrinomonadaceae bacterium]
MIITQNSKAMTKAMPLAGLAQKMFRPAQERGQARLPNFELIRLEVLIGAGQAFNVKAFTQSKNLKVGKAGLPPLFGGLNRRFAKAAVTDCLESPFQSTSLRSHVSVVDHLVG